MKRVIQTLCSILVVSVTAILFFLLGMSTTYLLGQNNWTSTKVIYVTETVTTTTTSGTTATTASTVEADTSAGTTTVITTSATTSMPTTIDGKLNINLATKEDLMTIKGIGEVYAERIIAYRDKYGPFTSLEQLMEIDGIGEGRYNQWAPYLTIE